MSNAKRKEGHYNISKFYDFYTELHIKGLFNLVLEIKLVLPLLLYNYLII
jgi:hypothetical protein